MSEQVYLGMHAGAKPEIFRFAEKLRENMTEEEKKLWEFLRLKPQGFKFRRQHPFSRYVLDFYCPELKLAIEIDGSSHNGLKAQAYDHQRQQFVESFGIQFLRFTNHLVYEQIDFVVATIQDKAIAHSKARLNRSKSSLL